MYFFSWEPTFAPRGRGKNLETSSSRWERPQRHTTNLCSKFPFTIKLLLYITWSFVSFYTNKLSILFFLFEFLKICVFKKISWTKRFRINLNQNLCSKVFQSKRFRSLKHWTNLQLNKILFMKMVFYKLD